MNDSWERLFNTTDEWGSEWQIWEHLRGKVRSEFPVGTLKSFDILLGTQESTHGQCVHDWGWGMLRTDQGMLQDSTPAWSWGSSQAEHKIKAELCTPGECWRCVPKHTPRTPPVWENYSVQESKPLCLIISWPLDYLSRLQRHVYVPKGTDFTESDLNTQQKQKQQQQKQTLAQATWTWPPESPHPII